MTIDELKQIIEQRTGVPAELLTGETAEENVAQAKAMLAYKRECEQHRTQTPAEQFAAWINSQQGGEDPQDTAQAALASVEEAISAEASVYPAVQDGGIDESQLPDHRSTREQFAEWIDSKSAFDPFMSPDGWRRG